MSECITRHPLLTDLYQLTMVQAYLEHGMTDEAVFEFFVRKLPPSRRFLMAAGLEQVIEFLQGLRFDEADIEWLQRHGFERPILLDYLAGLRFSGDVDALPEGRVFFANEPILCITAPLPLAQLVESRIMNLLHFSTLIASKAARIRLAAGSGRLVDFGMRRAHGAEAAMLAARAAYLAGFDGTATVLAGQRYAIPVFGTMAHSYVLAYPDELSAFLAFSRSHPHNTTLLIDTYDTLQGARNVVTAARILAGEGISIRGVRLDSGDLGHLSKQVRRILDEGGLSQVTVFASGNLDEYGIASLLGAGAPIDGFGVGTRMDVSADAPYLDCAYKLQEYAGQARRKLSPGKATWPGRKQVYRRYDTEGRMAEDIVTLAHAPEQGEPLLQAVMRSGRLQAPLPGLDQVRHRAREELAALPPALRELEAGPAPYPVRIGAPLAALLRSMDEPSG